MSNHLHQMIMQDLSCQIIRMSDCAKKRITNEFAMPNLKPKGIAASRPDYVSGLFN